NAGLHNLNILENGKSDLGVKIDTIVAYDSVYPSLTEQAKVDLYPAGYFQDVNQDGVRDLLVSVTFFDKVLNSFRETGNVLYYENVGKDDHPDFKRRDTTFFVKDMVDDGGYAAPVLWDMDNDEDLDLIFATNGDWGLTNDQTDYLVLYENIGTKSEPVFKLAKSDFLGLRDDSIVRMSPCLGDLNRDGTPELLIGQENGSLTLYDLVGSGKEMTANLNTKNAFGLKSKEFSSPFLGDVDGDGFIDLLLNTEEGRTAYYRNTSTTSVPSFQKEQDTFGGIRVGSFRTIQWYDAINDVFFDTLIFENLGAVTPVLVDLDGNNDPELVLGNETGGVQVYTNIRSSNLSKLSRAQDVFSIPTWNQCYNYSFGANAKPAFGDLNGDGVIDMVVGNNRGGIQVALGGDNCNLATNTPTENRSIQVFPNPAQETIRFDREISNALIYTISGKEVLSKDGSFMEMNVSDLEPGLYVMRLTTSTGLFSTKLVKSAY
ncbi:MAG: T9SS type A sorting domain-containing protein, partial [Bacteroidia bacterium]|nr:T9SS type A sorting domain-containing protein [Bacteroidia bacterium]